MTLPPSERTAVLVIRAWVEGNGEDRLRARITRTDDLDWPGQTSSVVATPEEVTGAVSAWLDALLRSGPG